MLLIGSPASDHPQLKLLESERKSALWLKLEKHINERIDVMRRRNDGDLDDRETARLRGKIAAFKELLELGQDPPQLEADDQSA